MNSRNNNIIETILKKKLKLAGKAVDCLPSATRPAAMELQTQVLTLLRDSLDQYLKNGGPVKEEPVLKKIELD